MGESHGEAGASSRRTKGCQCAESRCQEGLTWGPVAEKRGRETREAGGTVG